MLHEGAYGGEGGSKSAVCMRAELSAAGRHATTEDQANLTGLKSL